ncbi:MAG: hypothetical protein ACRDRN_21105 [Sciscionella sp.]
MTDCAGINGGAGQRPQQSAHTGSEPLVRAGDWYPMTENDSLVVDDTERHRFVFPQDGLDT